MMKSGQWALVLCAVLSWSCDGRHLGFGPGSTNMRGVSGEPDAGTLPPAQSDAGAAQEIGSGVDASKTPPIDSGGNVDGGNSPDATFVSCANLPPGIFPPDGVTCQQVAPQAERVCVADPFTDGRKFVEFVGCIQGASATAGAVCANGMCCHELATSFFDTPGYVCGITAGMQIVTYGTPLDTDQDLIPDYRDNCPYVPNTFGQDDDDDGDGIGNACDPCPEVPGVTCADAGATSQASCADLPAGIFPSGAGTCQQVDPLAGLNPNPFCVPPIVGTNGPLKMDFVGCKRGSPIATGVAEASCSNGICCSWLPDIAYDGAPADTCTYPGGMDIVAYGKALDSDQDGIPDYLDPCPEVPGITCTDAGAP